MIKPVQILLDKNEMMLAAQAGVIRRIENLTGGRRERYGATAVTGWQRDIEGALAEAALAKFLDVY